MDEPIDPSGLIDKDEERAIVRGSLESPHPGHGAVVSGRRRETHDGIARMGDHPAGPKAPAGFGHENRVGIVGINLEEESVPPAQWSPLPSARLPMSRR